MVFLIRSIRFSIAIFLKKQWSSLFKAIFLFLECLVRADFKLHWVHPDSPVDWIHIVKTISKMVDETKRTVFIG
jgi:hypothetical protein